ncbi:MAG: methyltransferase domain-containing protein [Dehalococcoidia bacterium]
MTEDLVQQDERSYLEFVGGLRFFSGKWSGELQQAYQRGADRFQASEGRAPATLEDAHKILDTQPLMQSYMRMQRSAQEMNWRQTVESATRQADELEQAMLAAEERAPGRLFLNPNLVYPDYFWKVDFHLQPGGMARDPLAGYINYIGVEANQKGITGLPAEVNKKKFVDGAPMPPDGVVRRVLDVGCAIGWTTWPLAERFPQAEVWGIDMSGPLVRFAHYLAVERGTNVRFAQMPAEAMTFPDNSFDMIHAHILYHEIPTAIGEQILREAFRVLRPGGIYAISDFKTSSQKTPFEQYRSEWSFRDNPEPYAEAFTCFDLLDAYRRVGFVEVKEEAVMNMMMRSGVKP